MQIQVNIQLQEGDNLGMTADQAAQAIMAALSGTPASDIVSVTVADPAHLETGRAPPVP
jgi:hypothetical protein